MREIALKQYEEGTPFFDVYPQYDLGSLPTWVQQRISDARVFGNSKQTLVFPSGEKYQLNNSLNDLSGGDWLLFTNSVESTWFPTSGPESYAHNIRKIHPTPKPPQLMKEIIEFFTKENELVLDYFMGVGGTLLGAALCNRRAVGVDLNQEYIDAYLKAAASLDLPAMPAIKGDALEVLASDRIGKELSGELVSLVLIDPPYGNMMSRKKTGADVEVYGNVATPFSNSNVDLGNMDSENWLASLVKSVETSMRYLKKRGYIVVFIKDLQPDKKNVNLLHADIINGLNGISDLYYKGLKIWADRSAKLFPYGYPLSFVANQTHQYILIFRKEK